MPAEAAGDLLLEAVLTFHCTSFRIFEQQFPDNATSRLNFFLLLNLFIHGMKLVFLHSFHPSNET